MERNVKLNKDQIDFLRYITEENDENKALERFATVMAEEKGDIDSIPEYLNKIMKNWAKLNWTK